MSMLVEELSRLSGDPKTWLVVAVLAALALHSLVLLFRCPYVDGRATFTADEIAQAKAHQFTPSIWFAAMMVAGIAATIIGLFMIANGIRPTLALALLVGGVIVIQSQPARFMVREYKFAVVAAQDRSQAILEGAQDRLRGGHRNLASINAIIFLAVTATLLAF